MSHRLLALALMIVSITSACSTPYTPNPDSPFEPIEEFQSSLAIALVNAQDDTELHSVGRGFQADYHAWTDVALAITGRELEKRGMSLDPSAQRSLTLSITNAKLSVGWVKITTKIDMVVETGDGLQVTFQGVNSSVMAAVPKRQMDGAMMRVVVAMLSDPRIVSYLTGEPRAAVAPEP